MNTTSKHKEEKMNTLRRCNLDKIIESLNTLKEEIEEIQSEEQDCFDNLPEGIQMSGKGESMEEACQSLDESMEEIDNVIVSIEEAKGENK